MDIREQKSGAVTIVTLTGRLDASTAGKLEEILLGLIGRGEKKLALNFQQVDFISSAGLRVLLMTAKRLKPLNGRVVLVSLRDQVREVFEIAGFTALFPMYAQQDEAVKSFQ